MIYKSFKNLLFELKEAKSYEDKAKVFHEYFYNDKEYVEFICTNDSLDNPKERKVCYLSDLINPLKLLWNRDIVAISDILFMASRKKRSPRRMASTPQRDPRPHRRSRFSRAPFRS